MGDPFWLCLFKADFSDKNNIKGDLRVKVHLSKLSDITLDKNDGKKLNLTMELEQAKVSASLIFDSAARANESRDYMLYNKSQLPVKEAERVDYFLR